MLFRSLKTSLTLLAAAAVMVGGVLAVSPPATAAEYVWDIARGGHLYDNWISVLEADKPKATHPAYPKAGKKKGASTWRCKECHGWDYSGKDGAYAKGSHYTGIKGVRAMVGMDVNKIRDIIMDDTHAMKGKISHSAMEKLALFLSKGQIDTNLYIDLKSKVVNGNAKRGSTIYLGICAKCHGSEGKKINFKKPPKAEYVGTVCKGNPWEGLHKIRFGQPGIPMIALDSLGIKTAVDVLAYCATLPTK